MLFIFDWDGTIINSTAKIIRCMQAAAAEHQLSVPSDAAVQETIGLSLPAVFQTLYPALKPTYYPALRASYAKHFLVNKHSPSELFAGVTETLHTLKAQGHLLAIATGKSRQGLNQALNDLHWFDYFDASRCSDETACKPNPQMLDEILLETHTLSTNAVMIGDTEYDLQMAAAINMPSIAVSYGAHSVARLARCKPNKIIDRFDELLNG